MNKTEHYFLDEELSNKKTALVFKKQRLDKENKSKHHDVYNSLCASCLGIPMLVYGAYEKDVASMIVGTAITTLCVSYGFSAYFNIKKLHDEILSIENQISNIEKQIIKLKKQK